jgi:hypothetical protein
MKLTDSHLIVLSNASQRLDRSVLPLPPKLAGDAGAKIVRALIRKKLIVEDVVGDGVDALPVHRTDKHGVRLCLVIADAGVRALGADVDDGVQAANPVALARPATLAQNAVAASLSRTDATNPKRARGAKVPRGPAAQRQADVPLGRKLKPRVAHSQSPGGAAAKAPREDSKLAKLIALLRRAEGASIDRIAKAMDWQHHSVRGTISGALRKKLGLHVVSERNDKGVRIYRIAG